MTFRIFFFLLLVGCAPRLTAQVEFNPYGGILTGRESLRFVGPTDAVTEYGGRDWIVGTDLLFGAGQLAPLAGLLYRSGSLDGPGGESFAYDRLYLPIGVGYKLLSPDFDINLVPTLAVAPGLVVNDGTSFADDRSLTWNGRAGARLFLDFVSLGVDYLHDFSAPRFPEAEGERRGRWLLSVGLRW